MNMFPHHVIALALLLMLGTGCTPLHISRTVSLKGLPPTNPEKIVAFKQEDIVNRPYQILGKVTYYRSGTRVTESASISEIRKYAAEIGADGVIGLHRNGSGGGVYSGIAVKWLDSGEKAKPKEIPFIVAMLPFNPVDPDEAGERLLKIPMAGLLESKGYYLQPSITYGVDGGIREARKLDDAALQNLGGLDADFLMELKTNYVNETKTSADAVTMRVGHNVQVEILNKKTRSIILRESYVEGTFRRITKAGEYFYSAPLSVYATQPTITYPVLMEGLMKALENIPPIHDEASY
jgi:hypothetical protein